MTHKRDERPSASRRPPVVFVGRNSRGNWVAREQSGIFGGLFLTRAQALKYALAENDHHPEAIVEVSVEIDLDIAGDRTEAV
ncbi:hypothetical protein IVB57_34180 [Bradyrhizobium sp. CW9]|uniref:hypothetical protein n=1 Tax=Bradyrhizobium sp. CW9 TaxID=2782689 RepID=UPI001FF9D1ED|nr:hypothetical protein [Bradyrhizobium sp. CW9]MCK1333252.1 hypothetical protein [Bradyrhizobium sp. CW9]